MISAADVRAASLRFGAAAGDLLLGARCAGCSLPGWGLCARCSAELDSWSPRLARPDPCPAGFPTTVAAGTYAGLASALITAHKDRQALSLAPVLGAALAASVRLLADGLGPSALPPGAERLVLVPAPSSARANRERGLNAGRAIAAVAARRLRVTDSPLVVVRPWLRQRANVRDQAGLDARERAQNLAGALRTASNAIARPGDVVIIVDDVVTTGATLTEAARVLAGTGIDVFGAATVAATARWRESGVGDLG